MVCVLRDQVQSVDGERAKLAACEGTLDGDGGDASRRGVLDEDDDYEEIPAQG